MPTGDGLHPVEQINELVQAVMTAEACFEIWRLLTFKNTDVDTAPHLRAFGAYRQFFMPSVHAHFIATVMALYRLFDSDSGVVRLSSCNDLRLKLTRPQNEAFRRKLGVALKIANRLAGVRNQLFGHRADVAIERVFDKAKLKRDELRRLIDIARELVDALRSAWDLPKEMWPANDAIADTARLLDSLGA